MTSPHTTLSYGLAVAVLCGGAAPCIAEPASITDVLPKQRGKAICFAAALPKPVAMEIEDWSEGKVKMQAAPGEFDKDAKPVMRPVPALLRDPKVASLIMSISAENLNPSEPYNFVMQTKIADRKHPLYSAGICAFGENQPGVERVFGCYIECDGGSIGVARAAESTAIAVTFDHDGGLRMTAGCSDETEQSFRVKSAGAQQMFRLSPVAAKQCAPLRAWLKRQ